ncbi:hypothetical protein QWZ13_00765 [Reinekea marina]|uniref:hypothetical protein n=1 Tax=Reinekea marina TaxID=1310421 RepID=UPI0025B31A5F|nr:hypothetical protein [Reinekea marina]MDN3647435.1 hypothetical protein [Reinekea marina]
MFLNKARLKALYLRRDQIFKLFIQMIHHSESIKIKLIKYVMLHEPKSDFKTHEICIIDTL